VLPNHKFVVYYSFTGIPLGFAFILFFNPTINYFKNLKNKNIGIYLQSIFIFLFFFLIIFNLKNNSYAFDYNWNLENQKRNINIFSSFDKIRLEVRDGDKVLVLGLNSNPHSPFQYEFPNHYMKFGNTSWTILDKNDFFNRHWQNVDYQTPDNTYLTDFDKVIIYDNNCNLKSILDKNKINQLGPINSTQLLNLDK
jgi:hypothetical protein